VVYSPRKRTARGLLSDPGMHGTIRDAKMGCLRSAACASMTFEEIVVDNLLVGMQAK
jgi:hypothetical protein